MALRAWQKKNNFVSVPSFHRFIQWAENPTLCLERDLELVEHMDRLGYHEAWFGEHHSAGTELYSTPEFMVLAAYYRTREIPPRHRR